jgi:hypothetical protein
MTCDRETFLTARLTKVQELITLYEQVLVDLAVTPNKSYTVNTGQTVETVTKRDVNRIQELLEVLYSQYDYFCDQLGTGGSVYIYPRQ